MAGIYIHIPFCKKACFYCDFHFSTSLRFKDDMIDAILKEIGTQQKYLEGKTLETIYFGGGTPSLLNKEELTLIINTVSENFEIIENPEITLEANPDDLTIEKLKELKAVGINRLSIGVQSFFDEHLKWMNRAHSALESEACIKNAQEIGFQNITIDLIYGMPNLTDKQWEENIKKALSLNAPHISAYNLTVEKNTALAHFVKKGKYQPLSDEKGAKQFSYLIETLERNGFEQYETSNFAKDKLYSIHNSSYWRGKHYLGIGPSAHSYNGNSRQWNIANNKKYIDAISNNENQFEIEKLSNADKINEHLLIGLRTIWGCNLNFIESLATENSYKQFMNELTVQIEKKMVTLDKNNIFLTPKGKLFADRIASDLFVE